jgi:hypothetical protein
VRSLCGAICVKNKVKLEVEHTMYSKLSRVAESVFLMMLWQFSTVSIKAMREGGKLGLPKSFKKSNTLPETSQFRKIEKADSGGLVVGKGDFFDVRTILIHHHYFSSN